MRPRSANAPELPASDLVSRLCDDDARPRSDYDVSGEGEALFEGHGFGSAAPIVTEPPYRLSTKLSMEAPFNVLFLCTGNSARSIIAECILNRIGAGKFKAYSAGSEPKGRVHPLTLQLLRKSNFDVIGLRSKSWDEFATPNAPKLDFVFTVCDNAANEVCPIWPGQPMTAHWGVPDPAAVSGRDTEKYLAFADTYRMLNQRISIFASLPIASISKIALQERLDEIGRVNAKESVT